MKTQVKALKVKIKSLAAEAAIIRTEERRALAGGAKYRDERLFVSLRQHRVSDVRKEQRSSMIAYAFLRGKPYKTTEKKVTTPVDVERVRKLIEKFQTPPGEWKVSVCTRDVVLNWLNGVPVPVVVSG